MTPSQQKRLTTGHEKSPARAALAVDLAAMSNLDDDDLTLIVVDGV